MLCLLLIIFGMMNVEIFLMLGGVFGSFVRMRWMMLLVRLCLLKVI